MRILAGFALTALAVAVLVTPAMAAGNMDGEWESADSTFKLELQGKGKCYISAGPVTSPCTWKQEGKKTVVKAKGEEDPFVFVANDDGSLSSASDDDDGMGVGMRLKKKK